MEGYYPKTAMPVIVNLHLVQENKQHQLCAQMIVNPK